MTIFLFFCKLTKSNIHFAKVKKNFSKLVTPQTVSTLRDIPEHITKPTYCYDYKKYAIENQKKYNNYLTREEVQRFRRVCELARRILEDVGGMVKAGVTTDYLDAVRLACGHVVLSSRRLVEQHVIHKSLMLAFNTLPESPPVVH